MSGLHLFIDMTELFYEGGQYLQQLIRVGILVKTTSLPVHGYCV